MKKAVLLASVAMACSTFVWSCKSEKLIPTNPSEQVKNLDSPDPLISYLAHLTKTDVSKIVLDAKADEYIIDSKVKISKTQIANSYKNANEYKLNNGIPKSN